jgi:hypothetical protein
MTYAIGPGPVPAASSVDSPGREAAWSIGSISTVPITDADEPDADVLSALVARLQSHHARASTSAGDRATETVKAIRDL